MTFRPAAVWMVLTFAAFGGMTPEGMAADESQEHWEPAKTHVVIAGVLEWKNPGFAGFSKANRKDQELYDTLLKCGVPEKNATLLLDAEATRAAVFESLKAAAQATAEDGTLIFYYAGHGMNRGNRFYLANYDAGNDPESTCLPITEFAEILKKEFRGKRVLFFADCCHSGGLRDAAKAIAVNGKQAAVLTSVAPDRISTGNWTFTETLLDGFKGRYTVDQNDDGDISFLEMADDVKAAMQHVEKQPYGFANFGLPAKYVLSKRDDGPRLPAGAKYRLGQFVTARDANGWVHGRLIGRAKERWLVELQSYSTRPVLSVTDDEVDEIVATPGPRPIPADAPALAEEPIVKGTAVLVEWGNQMWAAKILEIRQDPPGFRVHYLGWADSFDEWVTGERVVPLESSLEPSNALVEWQGKWWPAKILEQRKAKVLVHFVGWQNHWDEWVGENRYRRTNVTPNRDER